MSGEFAAGLTLGLYEEPDVVRYGVAELLRTSGFRIVGSERASDVVLVDPFPIDGVSPAMAFRRVSLASNVGQVVVGYSAGVTPRSRMVALRAGCIGLADKNWSGGVLADYIASVLTIPDGFDSPVELDQRRLLLVQLVADGRTNKQIAAKLSLSEETVKKDLEQVMRSLGLRNRAHVASWAAAHGLAAA